MEGHGGEAGDAGVLGFEGGAEGTQGGEASEGTFGGGDVFREVVEGEGIRAGVGGGAGGGGEGSEGFLGECDGEGGISGKVENCVAFAPVSWIVLV